MNKYFKISEVSKILKLIDPVTQKPLNHIIRYWEKEFKQIKPKKINNRRYYSIEQVEMIKMIKFLLRNKGMTIEGAKKMISINTNELDDSNMHSLRTDYYKENIKKKSKQLLEKLKKIKSYGKKNSS